MIKIRKLLLLAVVASLIAIVPLAVAEPSHVYLTYSGAPETTIDVNVILPERASDVVVYYDTEPRDGNKDKYAHQVKAPHVQTLMELSDERAMHVGVLSGLEPGKTYYFVAGQEEFGYTKERKFRTLPGGTNPVRFVNGGDMGVDGLVIPLLTHAGKADPDFGLIGGDIAYVNGLLGEFAKWDKWLDNWDKHMVTTDGRMIPIVTAIGNHETNDYRGDDYAITAPWYTSLFGRQGENIYYTRKVGDNLVLFLLDSGHVVPHGGAQAEWLKRELEAHQNVQYKFAAYHVPLYPAHRDFEGAGSKLGREHWGPLFDQYGLTVGLEHHDHVFKRTKPIVGGQVNDNGTVYIGDGCFGRPARTVEPALRWYNEKQLAMAHFWIVDVSASGLKFEAINHKGESIDSFELPGN